MSGGGGANPTVSVVIPTYDYAHFVGQAVDSVRRQTLDDWECIVVDDGSTDDTAEVVRALQASDPRILYYPQANSGLAAARNAGLVRATGRYVQFLDADDLLAPEKLEVQATILDANPQVGVCYSGYQRFRSDTGEPMGRYAELAMTDDPLRDFLYRWQRGFSIPMHCALFRRDLWPDARAFESGLRAKEDWLMWIDLALRGVRFQFIDRDLAWYRAHRGNMTVDRYDMLLSFARAAEIVVRRLPDEDRERFVRETSAYLSSALEERLGAAAREDVKLRAPLPRRGRGPSPRNGSIVASPNPILALDGTGLGRTTIKWRAAGDGDVEVRIDGSDGQLFASGGSAGEEQTGPWVQDGTAFFLQDASVPDPSLSRHTVAVEIVRVIAPLAIAPHAADT